MKEISYKNITIGQVQCLNKSGYFSEIICDGDNLRVGLLENEYKVMKTVTEVVKQFANAIEEISTDIFYMAKEVTNNLCKVIYPIMNKKISKKKFVKLLQSQGVQRNEINKIVQGNKDKYTYLRYYNIVKNLYEKQ